MPPPKSSLSSDGSSSIKVQWEPIPDIPEGLVRGYIVFLSDINTTIVLGPCITNTTVVFSTCIEVAAFTMAGLGNTTGCLSIEKAAPVVNETAPKISASIRRSLTTIQVKWDPSSMTGVKGDIKGYELVYELVKVNGQSSDNPVSTRIIICSNYTEHLLTELSPFAEYKIQIAAVTLEGTGKFSNAIYGETCPCPEFITVPSSLKAKPQDLDLNSIASGLTKVISDLLIETCGLCEEYNKTKLMYSNESTSDEFVFPVTKTSYGHSAYSKFIPVIQVPGVVVVTRKGDLSAVLTKVAGGSVLQSWPISVITILLAMLAGIIIWFLDSKENSEQFPHQFIKGAGQGFWWSFVSMTTVGYGDLCPKSILAKIFAMVWFLVGLVIFSVFMGALASLLTVTTVKQTIGSPSGTEMKTVAVVADSPEKRVALGTLSGKLSVGKTFPDVKDLVQALKDGKVESILVDMYTPVKRKDLFNGTWFEVAKLLEAEISHGVLLQGHAVGLAEELEKMIIANDVQTDYLQEGNDDQGYEEDVEEEPVTFFEPSSPYYVTTMYASLAGLGVFLCCGLLYQALCSKKISGTNNKISPNTCTVTLENNNIRADMETTVEEFYKSFKIIVVGNLGEGTAQDVTGDKTFNLSCLPSEIKGVFREVWHDHKIQANNLTSLTEHPDFPENPRSTKTTNSFKTNIDHPRYGQRHRAYIAVPESGLYKFHVSCDSACALLIEAQHGSTFMRCRNTTRGVNMTSGRFYHMTVLHVGEESSQDLQVSFTTPNGTTETPIPKDFLIAYKADGILGEFTPGNWGAWGACHLGIQTRQRLCQSVPPVYSGIKSPYQLSDTKKCEACPKGWSLFNKHCYKLNNFTEGKNWSDARETCLNLNSDLVSIKSEDEDNFVLAFLSNEVGSQNAAWIGRKNGSQVWSDGSNATYVAAVVTPLHQPPPITCYAMSSIHVIAWGLFHCSWKLSQAVCKRRAIHGDNETCLSSPLGMETGLISNEQIEARSSYNRTTFRFNARLAGPSAWCPRALPNYLQVDLIVLHYICAVATQGFYEQGYFTTKYSISLKAGVKKDYYQDRNGMMMLQGNSNPYEVQVNTLEDGVVADWIRFWIGSLASITSCLRVEIYGRPFDNSTGPTGPPKILHLINHPTSLYDVEISWKEPRAYFLAGQLKGYKVIFFHADGTWEWTFGPETTVSPFGPFEKNFTFCGTVVALNYYGEGVAADCINITTRDGACPISWTRYRNSCYLTEIKPGTWTQAKEGCLSRNSQLVTITNYEENNFVAALANNVSWIGAQWNDSISDYLWVDGSEIGFTDRWINKRWKNSSCVGICASSDQLCSSVGAWHQDKCVHLKPFVCEREVAHESDKKTCSNMAVGFEYGILGEYRMTASSSWYDKVPWKARLAGEGAWCPQTNTSGEYLEVMLESLYSICAVAMQGLHAIGAYTKTYRLQLAINGSKWEWYNGGNSEILQGNDNSYEVVKQVFEPYIPKAQYVRIWPVSFCVHPCLRIEIYGEPATLEGPPSGPPTNLSIEILSMKTVWFTWNTMANYSTVGGEIRGFKLFYNLKGTPIQDEKVRLVSNEPLIHETKLRNLALNATYCASLLAYNDFGDGPRSECVEFNTPSVCLPGWTSYGGHCYRAVNKLKPWTDAEAHCLNLNSDLVSIHSDAENELVKTLAEQINSCWWIGLRLHQNELQWSDGSSVSFTNLQADAAGSAQQDASNVGRKRRQIDENNYMCVTYEIVSGLWAHESCSNECSFVCKRKDSISIHV
ncbi:hypothetical protein ACROYT_G042895 [Oculina patagonica]